MDWTPIYLLVVTQIVTVVGLWWKSEINARNIANNKVQVGIDQGAVETAKDKLIVSLADKYDNLKEQQYAAALREIEVLKDKTNSAALLTTVQSKLDSALAELLIVKAQNTELSKQVTRLLAMQPGTSELQTEHDIAADRAASLPAVASSAGHTDAADGVGTVTLTAPGLTVADVQVTP